MPLIETTIWNHSLHLETDERLFSPRQPDKGTMAMLAQVDLRPADMVLDLGCGYGLVGLAAALVLAPEQVTMVDIDPLAVETASRNAALNSLAGVRIICGDGPAAAAPDLFSLILCNPPYHTDFSVAKRLIEQSVQRLLPGGRLFFVIKRLDWYRNKMTGVFGGVRVIPVDGYYVLVSEKRDKGKGSAGHPAATTRTTRKHLKKMKKHLVG